MREETIDRIIVTIMMVICFITVKIYDYPTDWLGYRQGDTAFDIHVCYMLNHANIWHLAGNLFVLWIMRGRMYLIPSLWIAFLTSYLPAWSLYGDVGVTIGFSGVLFAIAGIKWGKYWRICNAQNRLSGRHALEQFLTRAMPFALIGIVIPHLNWCLHLYCLTAGLLYGRYRPFDCQR